MGLGEGQGRGLESREDRAAAGSSEEVWSLEGEGASLGDEVELARGQGRDKGGLFAVEGVKVVAVEVKALVAVALDGEEAVALEADIVEFVDGGEEDGGREKKEAGDEEEPPRIEVGDGRTLGGGCLHDGAISVSGFGWDERAEKGARWPNGVGRLGAMAGSRRILARVNGVVVSGAILGVLLLSLGRAVSLELASISAGIRDGRFYIVAYGKDIVNLRRAVPGRMVMAQRLEGGAPWTTRPVWVTWVRSSSDSVYLVVPLWIPLAVVALPTAWRRGRVLWRALFRRGGCAKCGYDLTGLAPGQGVCPECGSAIGGVGGEGNRRAP